MRYHPWLYSTLGLAVSALASCGEETTQPSSARDQRVTAPELAVVHNSWITRRDLWGTERTGFATATVPNAAGQSIVYVIGGRGASLGGITSVMAYNVATNAWTARAPLPIPLYGMSGAAVLNGKIYIAGGYYGAPAGRTPNGFTGLLMYDPAKNSWSGKSRMPGFAPGDDPYSDYWIYGAGGGVSGVIGNKLYVLTDCWEQFQQDTYGCDPESSFNGYNLLFRYNPLTDRWIRLPSPPPDAVYTYGRGTVGMGGVIGGKLYVVGEGGGSGRLAVYDPVTNQWTTKRGLGQMRYGAASVVYAGKLYLIGGTRLNADGTREVLRANIAYDPTTDRWINYAPLPTARTGLGGSRVTLNGEPRIEVIGGSRPGNNLQYIP